MLALLTARPWSQTLLLTALFLLITAAATLLACGPVAQPAPADGNVLPAAQPVPIDVPTALPPAQQDGGDTVDGPDDIPTPPPIPTETYPNIGNSQLQSAVVEFEEARDAASNPSGQSDTVPEDTTVYVHILLSGNKAEVADWLRSKGITPVHADDPDASNLSAEVPLSLLGELSQQDGVREIDQPIPPRPGQ